MLCASHTPGRHWRVFHAASVTGLVSCATWTQTLVERAKRPDLHVGRGILAGRSRPWRARTPSSASPSRWPRSADSVEAGASTSLMTTSLDEADLERMAEPPSRASDHIVGIGGGVVMDTAKYLAWRTGTPLVLAPSIISVDASVTNTVAIRRNGSVEYDGFVVAEPIIADLELIATAPARLNRAGVGDLLSIQTGRFDWALGARAGTHRLRRRTWMPRRPRSSSALYAQADEVAAVSDARSSTSSVPMSRSMRSCSRSATAARKRAPSTTSATPPRPITGRSFVHGELIGLGTVLMSGLQGNEQARAAAFLDRCGVEWRPDQLGLDRATLEQVLARPAALRARRRPAPLDHRRGRHRRRQRRRAARHASPTDSTDTQD